jgi:7-cyano-7-deazaguanine synthase in queuosine biosynthesis
LRRNRKEEYTAMESIVAKIKEKYPHLEERLLKTIIVDEHITDDTFNFNYEKLFYSKNLWPKKRKTHQYLFLSKYAYYHKKAIDIGVLGIHEKSLLAKFLKKKLVKTDDNFIIKIKNHPLTYLRFPLFGRTKEILLEKAQVNGYDDILKLTWSCWFPKDGKPCEKCPMCKERIVEHPDNKT